MDKDELSALTVVELKVRLKELGLTTSGKKADLITRLIESDDEEEDALILEDDDDNSEFDLDEVIEAEVFEAEIIDDEDAEF
ncbi:MAG TPA: SAP domain-containing protein, partial [Candidatus Thalassarchaeaceae archaeon]|nr:SAP domain-containing protein [Candidatus Thalassarchaeaceae archaeon]